MAPHTIPLSSDELYFETVPINHRTKIRTAYGAACRIGASHPLHSKNAWVMVELLRSRQKENSMTMCPIALVVHCVGCPLVKICPLKSILGDYGKYEPKDQEKKNSEVTAESDSTEQS